MDSVSEARLSLVNPALADKIRQLAVTLAGENLLIRVTQGLRTWEEQDALYAQGRTIAGKKVTNARGGSSWHNLGCACDLVPDEFPDDGKFTPDWNVNHPTWKRMVEVGESLGLTAGAAFRTFPDMPHFQLTGRLPLGAPNDETRQLYKDGGLSAVWDAVNSSL